MVTLAAAPKPDYKAAILLVTRLTADLNTGRARLNLTIGTQAKQIGITKTTLTRLYAGSVPTQPTILAGLRWLAAHGGA